MKKAYKKPSIEVFNILSLAEDFLTTSYEEDNELEGANGMGNSQGEIVPGKIPSLH